MLRTGNYVTESGEKVHVTRTATGYIIRYSDGTTTVIGEE